MNSTMHPSTRARLALSLLLLLSAACANTMATQPTPLTPSPAGPALVELRRDAVPQAVGVNHADVGARPAPAQGLRRVLLVGQAAGGAEPLDDLPRDQRRGGGVRQDLDGADDGPARHGHGG